RLPERIELAGGDVCEWRDLDFFRIEELVDRIELVRRAIEPPRAGEVLAPGEESLADLDQRPNVERPRGSAENGDLGVRIEPHVVLGHRPARFVVEVRD